MRCIRLAVLLVSTLFAALLLAPPAWAVDAGDLHGSDQLRCR